MSQEETEPSGESAPATLFLLSPADVGGRRARVLLNEDADFPLAHRVRSDGAPLGEVFSFLSGLYFRGKLAYARRFATSGASGVLVITTNRGLLSADLPVTAEELRGFGTLDIATGDPRYREALERDAAALPPGRVVLLGSIATRKYLGLLGAVLGERLYFPRQFVGLGDMSRGAMLLEAVRNGRELDYWPASELAMPLRPVRRAKKE